MKKVTRKTWLGCYKKTREWEDKMLDRDDDFVESTAGVDVVEMQDWTTGGEGSEDEDEGQDEGPWCVAGMSTVGAWCGLLETVSTVRHRTRGPTAQAAAASKEHPL